MEIESYNCEYMTKGISPLVAAVLLIAATMSIAGILAYWASSFVKSQVSQFENQTITSECQYADFKIYSCSYNTSSKVVALVLENYREVLLKEMTAYISFANSSIPSISLNETIPKGSIKSFSISGIDPFTKIIVKTHCPEITRESSCR
jgi:flagellin-like protein